MRIQRRAATLAESLAAITVSAVAFAVIAQGVIAAGRQSRMQQERLLAVQAAANELDARLHAPWSEASPQADAAAELPGDVQAALPGAVLRVAVTDEPGDVPARRIDVEIAWPASHPPRSAVRLTGWQYPAAE